MGKILVTGGAGFIGSYITDELIKEGHAVRILDNLDKQVHPEGKKPSYLNPKAEFMLGDVTKINDLEEALKDVDAVFNEAAAVGIGQSMYKVQHYVNTNSIGTANLLEILANRKHSVKRVIQASSMVLYGEGAYNCGSCGHVRPQVRTQDQIDKHGWEPICPKCHGKTEPAPITEDAMQRCNSVYAVTKKNQEDLVLSVCKAYGIEAVALRYFNVFGPRQSLNNPYTGVAAIFLNRVKTAQPMTIYEDGLQSRDFISVHDVARANILALQAEKTGSYNIGSGKMTQINKVAETAISLYNADIKLQPTGAFRKGDIRHCYADITRAREELGWEPKTTFKEGMKELVEWSKNETASNYNDQAEKELKNKGLL